MIGRDLTSATKTAPDKTGKQQGRWIPGRSGNLNGRPKGSRNRLSEEFLRAFAEDFEQYGLGVIEKVRLQRPQDYLRIGASLLPKQMDVETDQPRRLIEYSNEELLAIVANGIEEAVERVLVDRGHSPLTPEERRIV